MRFIELSGAPRRLIRRGLGASASGGTNPIIANYTA
jgi:hypothetical protein